MATSIAATILVGKGRFSIDFLPVAIGSLLVVLPCWVLLLPFVALTDNLLEWRPAALVTGGAIVAAVVIPLEVRYFFVNAGSNRMPNGSWFRSAGLKSGIVGAVACATYLGILKLATRKRIQQPS